MTLICIRVNGSIQMSYIYFYSGFVHFLKQSYESHYIHMCARYTIVQSGASILILVTNC